MSLSLTKELYSAIIDSPYAFQTISILPCGDSLQFAVDPLNESYEIGIPKKEYLRLFTEGHFLLNENFGFQRELSAKKPEDLQNIYYGTLSLLATANDHSAAWNLHEAVVCKLGRQNDFDLIEKDAKFFLALSTSRLARINKSSMLWHWLRKVFVALLPEMDDSQITCFAKKVLRSMQVHYANYSAGFTFVWVFRAVTVHRPHYDRTVLLALLSSKCKESLTDCSLWFSLGQILNNSYNVYGDQMFLRIDREFRQEKVEHFAGTSVSGANAVDRSPGCSQTGLDHIPGNNGFTSHFHSEASRLLRWLLDVHCSIEYPYRQLLRNQNIQSAQEEIALRLKDAEESGQVQLVDTLKKLLMPHNKDSTHATE